MSGKRHTYEEAADILRVDHTWLRRHIMRLPHSKKGHVVTFTDADLDAIDEMHRVHPATPAPAVGGQAVHVLADLKPKGARRA